MTISLKSGELFETKLDVLQRASSQKIEYCSKGYLRKHIFESGGNTDECEKIFQQTYKKFNDIKLKAKLTANRKIKESHCCFVCGDKKTIKHHPDYDKPLKVFWLCSSCHRKLHRRSGLNVYPKNQK
jgi:hypothetical protein